MISTTYNDVFEKPLTIRSIVGETGVPKLSSNMLTDFTDLGGRTNYNVPASPYNLCGSCDNFELATKIYSMPASYTGAPIYIAAIDNCMVTPTGAVITRDGSLILESLYGHTEKNFMPTFQKEFGYKDDRLLLNAQFSVSSLSGPTIYNRDVGEYGYFHWMNSILPRFGQISHLPQGMPKRYLISHNTKFAQRSLELLGIGTDQRVPLQGGAHYCERLYFLSPWVLGGNHWTRPPEIKEFYTELKDKLGIKPAAPGDVVYLSRNDASVRRLVNENEAVKMLERFRCRLAMTSGMYFEAQAEMFHNVKLCVSVHGAGLSNIVFMQPGTAVVEIISPDRLWPTYRSLAARMGVSYTAVFGQRTSTGPMSHAPGSFEAGNEDFSVSLSGLEYIMSEMI